MEIWRASFWRPSIHPSIHPRDIRETVSLLINYSTSASENDEELREDVSSYDPNFTDNMEEDIDEEDEDEYRDSANEYTDDGDVSWKVRGAAAKCLAALVVTQPEMLSKLHKQACSKLIDRFKERKSKMALNCCDKQAMLQKDSHFCELEPGQYNAEIKR
ncbi:hypothetical protein KY284_003264 [Solanum tuberosum]|nr:hypothetical protein KY284_003264 [Solanum tuberosum]